MPSVFTRASAAIDRSVVRFMERRMAPRSPRLANDARRRLIDVTRRYSDGTLGSPSPFFPMPEVPAIRPRPQGEGPLGTQVVDLAWASEYRPYHPEAREGYLSIIENMTAHARWWTSDKGRPTIVLIHGWGGGNHWVTARTFVVPYWLRHGYDVVSFQLPFHGARAPDLRGTPQVVKSGALFPSTNPLRTNEAFGHAIFDLRALALFLRARGSSAVGVMGMSLGGYTTALWASVAGDGDPSGVEFAVAMIPAVSFSRLMWSHGESSPVRRRAEHAGITEDLLADAFEVHAPTTRPAQLAKDRLYVIAGRGDRITPPDHAEELAAHWGVDILWFDGGHLAQVGRGDAMRTVRRALGAHGFSGRAFRS
jgi:pimeloyl-ACP methyl ester carboxylesterase